MGKTEQSYTKFGSFEGVFTPTVLTILGVILYARLGWVVGNAGLGGAILIIMISNVITLATSLSASTMVTNIKVEAGGAYSIISKSLGLEAGGAIGISLYFAQTLSVALYIFGFAEAVKFAFPAVEFRSVVLFTWIFLWIISSLSTNLAFKIQFIILTVIALSLVSFFFGAIDSPNPDIVRWGAFQDADFGQVYSIFFPAVTGILAGIGMSGDLKNPSRNIPRGSIIAILLCIVVYVGAAFLLDYSADSATLRGNLNWMLEVGKWKWLVVAGMMGATLSSGLGTIVSSPRLLQAMAVHRSVPFGRFLAFRTKKGEPVTATFVSSAIIGFALFYGSLDAVAPFITLFFLLTYSFINLSVVIEQNIGIASFRPVLKLPRIIPLIGFVGSTYMMFYIDFIKSLVALIVIIGLYFYLIRRDLEAPWGDVRQGLFRAIVEWAARRIQKLPQTGRSWKPDILVPVEKLSVNTSYLNLIHDIAYPAGSIHFLHVTEKKTKSTARRMQKLVEYYDSEEVYREGVVIESDSFTKSAPIILETMNHSVISPNSVFATFDEKTERATMLRKFLQASCQQNLGLLLFGCNHKAHLGYKERINLWLRERSPDWDIDKSPNWNLAILTALRLHNTWDPKITICMVINQEKDRKTARKFLEDLITRARLPLDTNIRILHGKFFDAIRNSPETDLNIFGIGSQFDFSQIKKMYRESNTSCLFIRDAGFESVLNE